MQKLTRKHISIFIAFAVFLGVALHDTKLDTMTKFIVALPAVIASLDMAHSSFLRGEAHTHVERVSAERMASRATALTAKLPTRNEDRKYRLNVSVQKGHHPFDSYFLPMVA